MYTIQGLWTQARERLDVTTVIFNNRKYQILIGELANVGAAFCGGSVGTGNAGASGTGGGVSTREAGKSAGFNCGNRFFNICATIELVYSYCPACGPGTKAVNVPK